ncbi:hypothetical protein CQ009_05490 [Pseudomonas sp. MYb2]|nr:hypothetical protein CQ025_20300 [Pseudomonas sp. MYb3]PRC35973.1 hypothetical protein CQ009_05490 [Pseudomonas sp. MYb2]
MIVPTLRVGMPPGTLRVPSLCDAERHWMHSHAERGNDKVRGVIRRRRLARATRQSSAASTAYRTGSQH